MIRQGFPGEAEGTQTAMSTRSTDTAHAGSSRNGDPVYRLLILANEMIGDEGLVEEILRHARGRQAEARIVAPALVKSPLDLAAGDVDDDIEAARQRLEASIESLRQHGIEASGMVGEADPNLALDDALRLFHPDEVIIVVHPQEERTWLESDLVERARRELTIPITVVEVQRAVDGPAVRDVQEIMPGGERTAANRDQAAFEANYLPPMPLRDKAALVIGPLGCVALALLAIDCQGQVGDFNSWDAGCYASWVGGVYAFIVTAIHVPAILVLQGDRYAGGLRNFMAKSILYVIPLLVLVAGVAVLLS